MSPLNADTPARFTVPSLLTEAVAGAGGGSNIVTVNGSLSGSEAFFRTLMLARFVPPEVMIVLLAVGGLSTVTVIMTVPVVLFPAASVAVTPNESLPVKFAFGV